jgi:hypothetical protein
MEQILLHASIGEAEERQRPADAGLDMKEITIWPAKFKNREDRDQARALLARKVLWELLAAAESQVGPLRWISEGGLEAAEFLERLDAGRWHPLLKQWWERRKTANHRPAASARERHAQKLLYLATVALDRAISLGPGEARDIVARRAARLFEEPPTAKKIEHWQANQPPLSTGDWQVLATAISGTRSSEPGGDERLADFFIGIAHAVMSPGTLISTE